MLSPIDWAIILIYMVFSIGLGLYYMKRGSQNLEEYFVAGLLQANTNADGVYTGKPGIFTVATGEVVLINGPAGAYDLQWSQ